MEDHGAGRGGEPLIGPASLEPICLGRNLSQAHLDFKVPQTSDGDRLASGLRVCNSGQPADKPLVPPDGSSNAISEEYVVR